MDLPTWGLFVLGAIGGGVTVIVGKYSNKLFQGRSIDQVVNSANSIIKMYESHIGLLETKVNDLETKLDNVVKKLDEALADNLKLQKLLLASPAVTLPPEASN